MFNPEIADGMLEFRPVRVSLLNSTPEKTGDKSCVAGLTGIDTLLMSSNLYFSIFFLFKKLGPCVPIGFEPLNFAMCLYSGSIGDCYSRAVTVAVVWSCKNCPFKTSSSIYTFNTCAFFAVLFFCCSGIGMIFGGLTGDFFGDMATSITIFV